MSLSNHGLAPGLFFFEHIAKTGGRSVRLETLEDRKRRSTARRMEHERAMDEVERALRRGLLALHLGAHGRGFLAKSRAVIQNVSLSD